MPKVTRMKLTRTYKDLVFEIVPLTAGADLEIQEKAVVVKNKIAFSRKMELSQTLRNEGRVGDAEKVEEEAEQMVESKSGSVRLRRILCCLKSWNMEDADENGESKGILPISEDSLKSIETHYFNAIEAEILKASTVPTEAERKN